MKTLDDFVTKRFDREKFIDHFHKHYYELMKEEYNETNCCAEDIFHDYLIDCIMDITDFIERELDYES